MPLNINQEDFNVVKQPFINKYLKLNVLNFNLSVVNEISGNLISFDVSVNADSDLRRSCSVSFVVTDSSFEPESGSQIWLNSFIQPYVGYENIYTGEVQWYNQGIYLINTPTYFYDATNNTLSFQGLDLMSKLTGVRNGALPGVPTIIPQGSSVREAMIAAIKLAGFTKYVVNECTNTDGSVQAVPYDIQVNQSGYVFDIIKQLRDILPNYQVYFDVDGVFHYDQIPSGDNDPVLIDDTLWNDVNMSDNITTDFESVKNYIEVYGKSHTVNYFPSATSVSGGTLNLTIAGYTETAGNMIGFVPTTNIVTSAYVKVNNGTARRLVDSAGNGVKNLDKDVYYVAVYQSNNTYLFLGHQQAQAIATDDNPESPFYVDGSVGMIRQVLSGGDYDNIMSDELALQRAKLEIYWKCRLNDSIALTCIPIPWVDVNILVSHAPKNSTRQKKYMVKSFNASYGDNTTMTINAISYYAYYSPTPKPEPVLPEGYTQLNYIQSTGTQYIDTGVTETADMAVSCHFDVDTVASDYLFGSQQNSENLSYNGIFKNNMLEYNYSEIGFTAASSIELTEEVTGSTNNITINGVSHTLSTGTPQNVSMLIFGIRRNTGAMRPYGGQAKLWYFKIKKGSNIVRDFLPCKNPTGTVGLYDLVGGEFYTTPTAVPLPAGYTQVEYLKSTGTQYINVGFKPNQDTRIVLDVNSPLVSGPVWLFGARTAADSKTYNFLCQSSKYRSDYNDNSSTSLTINPSGRFEIDKDKNITKINGSTASTIPYGAFQCEYSLYLFSNNNAGATGAGASISIYSCKIYDNGTLIRNMVPVKNSSGTLGMYDIVNGVFYTNAGTGTFVAGAEINHNFIAGAEV